MSKHSILRLGSVKDIAQFQEHLCSLHLDIPCDRELACSSGSPLRWPLVRGGVTIGNRIAVQPMEGWDASLDGSPTERTFRRWRRFGSSGAKMIWGGEAVAISHEGRANPNQLLIAEHTETGLARLRKVLVEEHRRTTGSDKGLVVGLQLTHSGRYSHPNAYDQAEPCLLYHHPILDKRLGAACGCRLLTDVAIEAITEKFHHAAKVAWKLGFDFVDIKHCHGYLAMSFLALIPAMANTAETSRTVPDS